MQWETLLEQPRQPKVEFQPNRDDAETMCAEVLDGRINTDITLTFDGQELYDNSDPPRAMGKIFGDAITDAERLMASSPKLGRIELPRRLIEKEEYQEMIDMMLGKLPNTMIVESDQPHALKDETENIGGYNVHRRQTFQRIITRESPNTIRIRSGSLDRSDRDGLEAIYHHLDTDPQKGELLGQRIHRNLNADEQDVLQEELTGVYDATLSSKYNVKFVAGRSDLERANTYDFVRKQGDLIDAFTRASSQIDLNESQKENLLYQLSAAMTARWEGKADTKYAQDPLLEMHYAAEEARAGNRSFSGCGLTLNSDSENNLSDAGYGNKIEEMHCPFCRKKQFGDPCSPNQKCTNKKCEAEVKNGKVTYKGHGRSLTKLGEFVTEGLRPEHSN
jgi:hypothetical protein